MKYVEEKGTVTMDEFHKDNPISFLQLRDYLVKSRIKEFDEWAIMKNYKELESLNKEITQAKYLLDNTLNLNPVWIYHYFRKNQTNLTGREHDTVVHYTLYSLLRGAVFELEDYKLLDKELKKWHQYHYDTETHYRWAVMANNRSAIKSIEKYLNRKPFLIGTKRCYEDFKFCTGRNEHYKCTGFDESKIKFVLYENGMHQGTRKLFKFDNKGFKKYFKDKKII